jgi:hypothetical protein
MQQGMPSAKPYICQGCGKALTSQMAWRLPGGRAYRCKPCHLATFTPMSQRTRKPAEPVPEPRPTEPRPARQPTPRQNPLRWRWAPR